MKYLLLFILFTANTAFSQTYEKVIRYNYEDNNVQKKETAFFTGNISVTTESIKIDTEVYEIISVLNSEQKLGRFSRSLLLTRNDKLYDCTLYYQTRNIYSYTGNRKKIDVSVLYGLLLWPACSKSYYFYVIPWHP